MIALCAAGLWTQRASSQQSELSGNDWRQIASYPLETVPEPSGLCFWPATSTLFVVDDGGAKRQAAVAQLNLQGQVLQRRVLGQDLEGICYCSADDLLYVCDEAGEQLYALDPHTLKLKRKLVVSRSITGAALLQKGGDGFEGIAYLKANGSRTACFLLLNQNDPACIIRIPAQRITRAKDGAVVEADAKWLLPALNAGELYYNSTADELWVVHSWMNLIEVLDGGTMQLLRWEALPGQAQEGVTLDATGRLWIGADTGGLSCYTRIPE